MADDNKDINQDEIEELLKKGNQDPSAADSSSAAPAEDSSLGQDEIEALLNKGNAPTSAEEDDGDKTLAQGDIEALLAEKGVAPKTQAAPKPATTSKAGDEEIAQEDIELLLRQAETALASIEEPSGASNIPGMQSFKFEEFRGATPSEEIATLDLIRDVEMDLRIELGRTHMHLEDILKLRKGSVVPLDKLAGDPVDVYVNGRLIARGEVLVLNDNFCVRVAELLSGETARAG